MSFVIAKYPRDTTAVQCSDVRNCSALIVALKSVCVKRLAFGYSDVSISFCLLRIVIIYNFFTVLVTLAMNGPSLCILSELCSWYRQTLLLVSFEPTFGNNRNLILIWVNDRWK
jgi:hypothetical protein